MVVKYKYGLLYNGFLYGWNNKELFRLPCTKNLKSYSILKLKKWSDKGYHVGRDKKSFAQLKDMTIFINYEYQEIKDKDLPF